MTSICYRFLLRAFLMRVVKSLSPLTKPSTRVNFKSRASFIHHGFKSLNKKVLCMNLRQPLPGYKKYGVGLQYALGLVSWGRQDPLKGFSRQQLFGLYTCQKQNPLQKTRAVWHGYIFLHAMRIYSQCRRKCVMAFGFISWPL